MDEGEQALAELASRIERMDARAKNLAHTLSRLVAVNRIYVSNFDQYSETIRLGLAWGFIDAAAQLAELHVNQIAPALPVIFGTLRLDDGLVGDVLDFDAPTRALSFMAEEEVGFVSARDAAGEMTWTSLPLAFDESEGKPGLAYTIFRHALIRLSDQGVLAQAPEAANPCAILERVHKLMRSSQR